MNQQDLVRFFRDLEETLADARNSVEGFLEKAEWETGVEGTQAGELRKLIRAELAEYPPCMDSDSDDRLWYAIRRIVDPGVANKEEQLRAWQRGPMMFVSQA